MHRFIPEPGAPPSAIDPTHTIAIKRWTTEILGLPDGSAVHVAETPCADSGCPLVETVITVLDSPPAAPRCWRLTRARAAVTRGFIRQILLRGRENNGSHH